MKKIIQWIKTHQLLSIIILASIVIFILSLIFGNVFMNVISGIILFFKGISGKISSIDKLKEENKKIQEQADKNLEESKIKQEEIKKNISILEEEILNRDKNKQEELDKIKKNVNDMTLDDIIKYTNDFAKG
jgi:hypothetical protein